MTPGPRLEQRSPFAAGPAGGVAVGVSAGRAVGVAVWAALVLAALAPLAAHAHPVTARSENNRYVKLTVMGDRLRVAYSVLYGELPSFYERREMDTDHDGRVSPAEARAHADALAARLAAASVLTVNGARVPLHLPDRDWALADPRVGPIPFSVDMWELVPLDGRRRVVVSFEAGDELPRAGETEVKFEEAPGTRLLAWCRGPAPCAARTDEPRFVWPLPRASSMEDRTVTAVFGRAGGDAWLGVAIGAGAGVALVAAVVVVMVRRRRRRKAT